MGLYSHFEKPVNQEVSSNPWYGLNDGTNQWHLQALQDSNKLGLGLTWDSSLKIDTDGNVTLPANLKATATTDLGKAPPYVCVFDANGWLYKRTLAALFSDMGIPAQKDYVVERGTSSGWHYEKWNSGVVKAWRETTSSNLGAAQDGGVNGWYYRIYTMDLPSGMFKTITSAMCNCKWGIVFHLLRREMSPLRLSKPFISVTRMVGPAPSGMRLLVRGNKEVCYESVMATSHYPIIRADRLFCCSYMFSSKRALRVIPGPIDLIHMYDLKGANHENP